MNKIFILLIGIMLVGIVGAWSEDEFNNSLTEENITFSGNENYTRWLSVPEDNIVTNGYLNLSGYNDKWNKTFIATNQNDYDTIFQIANCNDGDLDTVCYKHPSSGGGACTFDGNYRCGAFGQNYTIPTDTMSDGTKSITVDVYYRCLGIASSARLYGLYWKSPGFDSGNAQAIIDVNIGAQHLTCDATGDFIKTFYINETLSSPPTIEIQPFISVRNGAGSPRMEIQDIRVGFYNNTAEWGDFPNNVTIVINNTITSNHNGELNSTNSPQQTSNIYQTINNYIEKATAVAGYYLIPFIFHSDTAGILEYANLIFNNNGLVENSQTYPTTALESSTQTYTANITFDSSRYTVSTGTLYFNGDEYAGSKTTSGQNTIFSADAIMPSISIPTNYTTYWTISLTDVTNTTDYNLTAYNTTVSPINFSLCDATNNVSFWNFTVLNESNGAEINSTFEGTFTVKITGSTTTNEFSFSDLTGTNSQFDFCITPGDESYTINTNIKLTKSGYVDKFYNYEEVVVTNATREDNLYMLASADSTSFIIHTVDVSGADVTEAEVRVQRYYPGSGEWITTEIVTTNYIGEAIGHLLSEDADYRFKVYQDGVSVHNSSSTKIACASSPCTVTLVISLSLLTGYETVEDLTSTLVYNPTTNTFTYTYSDTSGSFTSARLYVIRLAPSNATIVVPCNETKTTASGVITCNINGNVNGTYQATGYITRTEEVLDKRISGAMGTKIYNAFGNDGVLWAIFIIIGIVMVGIGRPSLAIIMSVVAVIVVGLLQIINIGYVSIISIAVIGIILLMKVGRE